MPVAGSGSPTWAKSRITSSNGSAMISRAWNGSALARCCAFRLGICRGRTTTCGLATPRITRWHLNPLAAHSCCSAAVTTAWSSTAPFTMAPGGSGTEPIPCTETDGAPALVAQRKHRRAHRRGTEVQSDGVTVAVEWLGPGLAFLGASLRALQAEFHALPGTSWNLSHSVKCPERISSRARSRPSRQTAPTRRR